MTVYSLTQCIDLGDRFVYRIICLSDMTFCSLVRYIDGGDDGCTSDRVVVRSVVLFATAVYCYEYSAMTVYSLIQLID